MLKHWGQLIRHLSCIRILLKQTLFFSTDPSEPLGTVTKGDSVAVTEQKLIRSLLGTSVWYKVAVIDTSGNMKKDGWLYGGTEDGIKTVKIKK